MLNMLKNYNNLLNVVVVLTLGFSLFNIVNYYQEATTNYSILQKIDLIQSRQLTSYQRRKVLNHPANLHDSFQQIDLPNINKLHTKKIFTEKRVQLGFPVKKYNDLILWKLQYQIQRQQENVQKTKTKSKSKNVICSFINAVNIPTIQAFYSAISMLIKYQNSNVFILTTKLFGERRVNFYKILKTLQLKINKMEVRLDSDYNFFTQQFQTCHKLVYFFGNTIINEKMAESIYQQSIKLKQFQCLFTQNVRKNGEMIKLPNLLTQNLSKIDPKQFYNYLYILDMQFIGILTPLNYAYYTKYTIQEILLFPILTIVQNSKYLLTTKKQLHNLKISTIQHVQFKLISPQFQQRSMCFINYPSNSQYLAKQQYSRYLNYIKMQQISNLNVSLISYAPYEFNSSKQNKLFQFAKKLLQMANNDRQKFRRVKLRIMDKKATCSHAAYEGTYVYCPKKSLITTSRHNILFLPYFSQRLIQQQEVKSHYYLTQFQANFQNAPVNLKQIPPYNEQTRPRKSNIFTDHLKHFQIFKSDLLKSSIFHVLKSAEVDFYQTQAPLVLIMMQEIHMRIKFIRQVLVKIENRSMKKIQQQQINYVKSYAQYWPLVFNQLNPYQQNCLQNQVYKRSAPLKMPKKIHQIWISKQQISEIRIALRNSIIQANPGFEVVLYKLENITRQLLPITYHLVQRTLQYDKTSQKSYMSLVADLMRYQIVYHKGGIYIDFKMEGKKNLEPFLKYQIFFIDSDISSLRFNRPQVVGNGIIGATQNNYYLAVLLKQLILEQGIDYKNVVTHQTGSFVARRSINSGQFFYTLGLGFQLLYSKPYVPIVNQCGGQNKVFDNDQKVYQVIDRQYKIKVKIGLPCKAYPEAYLISYTPLAKTWTLDKDNQM